MSKEITRYSILDVSKNKVLFILFCGYVFLAPFEDLLEYLYGIKTVFKPYRLVGMIILIYGFFHEFRKKRFFVFKWDVLAVFFLLYGIGYTVFLFTINRPINFTPLVSTQIQMTFLILIMLVFKRIEITYKQAHTLFAIMSLGIFINAMIILVDFYVLHLSSREKGLSDNPNYAAFAQVITIFYLTSLIMKRKFRLFNIKNLFNFALIATLFATLLATGSRSGFLVLVIGMFVITIVLTNTQTKVQMLPVFVIVALVVFFGAGFKSLADQTTTFNRLTVATEDIRVPLAKAGYNAIVDSYGLGIGVAQMINRPTFAKYIAPVDPNLVIGIEARDRGLSLHNMYIEIASETGFIGLGVWLYYLFQIVKYQWKKFQLKDENQGFHRLLIVCMVALLLTGMTGKGLLGGLFWFTITICGKDFLPDKKTKRNPITAEA